MLEQTKKLIQIFDKEQKNNIDEIIEDMKKNGDNYRTDKLWQFDQSIGGIGGYCQGCDPANSNPFQGTIFRNAYRCFQYVRADIDILDVNYTARNIIENCGHHFEEAIKIYLGKFKRIEYIRVRKYPLGKLLNYISEKNIFDVKINEELKLFVDLYNISKHEILSDDKIDRTFHIEDALICYFASRIFGRKILVLVDSKIEQETYEINWNKYGKKLIDFNY